MEVHRELDGALYCSCGTPLPHHRENSLYFAPFALHVRVNIPFEGNIGVSVAHHFAQCFDVTACLQASSCKSMAQGMRMHLAHCCTAQIAADTFAVTPRFDRLFCASGKEPGIRGNRALQCLQHSHKALRNRNFPTRAFCFRGLYDNFCLSHTAINTAYRPADGQGSCLEIKIALLQPANLTDAQTQLHLQQ